MKIIDYIKKNNCTWAVQIFQNILSMCDLIPLRIFDRKTAAYLFKDFKENIENVELTAFADDPIKALELTGIPDKNLETHVTANESPWITTPSYSHPFWEEMKTSYRFTFWEQALIYKWIIHQQGKNQNEQIKSIISDKFLIGISQLKEIDSDWFLISGPVFHFSGANITGEEFNKNMVLPLIDHLSEWLWPEIDGFLLSEQQQEMNLWGSLRPCWDRDGFKDHFLLISRILGNLLSAQWSEESPLRRCMCHDLVRKSWLLYTPTLKDVIYRLENENKLKNYAVSNLRFSFPLASHHSHVVDAYSENKSWKFKIFPNEAKLETPQITTIKESSPGLLKRLKYFFIDNHRKKEDSRFTLEEA